MPDNRSLTQLLAGSGRHAAAPGAGGGHPRQHSLGCARRVERKTAVPCGMQRAPRREAGCGL